MKNLLLAGLSASCETILDAKMLVEMPAIMDMSIADSSVYHEVQLDETSDTAVVQYFVPDVGLEELNLFLKLSCDDCEIVVHVTAYDHLVGSVINSTTTSLPFRPYAGAFHYVTLRLLSGNASKVTMRLPTSYEHRTDAVDQVTPIVLSRKTFPEFFLFDYEYLHDNDTEPQPLNVTADTLSVLSFEIGKVYDVGGTVTLGFKLIDVEEKYKKDITLVACVSLGWCLFVQRLSSLIPKIKIKLLYYNVPKLIRWFSEGPKGIAGLADYDQRFWNT